MTQRKASLATIFGIVFIDLVGFGIVIPVLPLYAKKMGASALDVGFLLGIYSLMQLVFAPILGKLSDRVGRRPVLFISLLGSAAGFFLMGMAGTLWILFLARIIDGITGGNISTAQAYIADVTSPRDRSKGMGVIGAAFGLGFIFGPALGGIFSRFSMSAPFFFAAFLALANSAAVYFFLPESLTPERRHHPHPQTSGVALERLFSNQALRWVILVYFLNTIAFSMLMATYPLFTHDRFGFGAEQNGYLFACLGLLGAVIQGGLLGWLTRFSTDRILVMAGAFILAVNFFLLPLAESWKALLLVTAGIAVGHGLMAAPLNGLASKNAGNATQGRVLGVMQSWAAFARMVGPVVGGALLHQDAMKSHFGRTPFWVGGVILLAALAFAWMLPESRGHPV